MGGRCAVPVVLALWLGMAGGVHLDAHRVLLSLALAVTCACAAVPRWPRAAAALLLAAVGFAGAARAGGHSLALERARRALPGGDALVRLVARVVEPPADESGTPLVCAAALRSEPALPRGTRVRLRLGEGDAVEWGDRIEALARLERPSAPRNPGGLDAEALARASGIAATGRAFWVRGLPARGSDAWARATFGRWRAAIARRLDHNLSGSARELVVPLVLGDRSGMPPELGARLRASGLIHLIALSGLHVTWMAGGVRVLVGALGAGVVGRAAAGALCALIYVGVAGPIPSLMRAAATEALASLARARSRPLDPLQALAASAVALLVACPGWAGDLGFQLSCAATLGLVTLGRLRAAPRRFAEALGAISASLGAQIVALPILLARFHAVPWVAPLSNLAAVPLAGLLLAAAWIAVLVDGVLPGAGAPWFHACEALSPALNGVVAAASRWPGAGLGARADGGLPLIAVVAAVALVLATLPPRTLAARERPGRPELRAGALCLGLAAGIAVLALAAGSAPLVPRAGSAWLVALDVGQGDAIALGFPEGWWLVDAGPRTPSWDAGESAVLPFLRWAGVHRLERLVLTHDDGDHTGGAVAVLRSVDVDQVLAPPALPGAPGPARRFRARGCSRRDTLHAAPLVRVLWPDPAAWAGRVTPRAGSHDNAACLVLEVGEERGRALLLGDVDSSVEVRLEAQPGVALLKIAHHGSSASSAAAFLSGLEPREAIVSCGRRNPFGHPNAGVLARLRAVGARVARTDEEGALWYEIRRSGARRLPWRAGSLPREPQPPGFGPAALAAAPRSP